MCETLGRAKTGKRRIIGIGLTREKRGRGEGWLPLRFRSGRRGWGFGHGLHQRCAALGGAGALLESAGAAALTWRGGAGGARGPTASLTRTLLAILGEGEEGVLKALPTVPPDVGLAFHFRRSQSPGGSRERPEGSPELEGNQRKDALRSAPSHGPLPRFPEGPEHDSPSGRGRASSLRVAAALVNPSPSPLSPATGSTLEIMS